MRTILVAVLFAFAVLALGGCFITDDTKHNKEHMRTFERDIEDMHYDLEALFSRPDVENPPDRGW